MTTSVIEPAVLRTPSLIPRNDPLIVLLNLPSEEALADAIQFALDTEERPFEPVELPSNNAGDLAREIEEAILQTVAERDSLLRAIDGRAAMLGKCGDPHDKVPDALRGSVEESLGVLLGALGKLRDTAISMGKREPRIRGDAWDVWDGTIDNERGRLRVEKAKIPELAPPIRARLGDAVEQAADAYAAYLFAPETEDLRPLGSGPSLAAPVYPGDAGGKLEGEIDAALTHGQAILRQIESAITAAADRLTKAGGDHAAVPDQLRTFARAAVTANIQTLEHHRGMAKAISSGLAEPEADTEALTEQASETSAAILRAREAIDALLADCTLRLDTALSGAEQAYGVWERENERQKGLYAAAHDDAMALVKDLQTWDAPEAADLSKRFAAAESMVPNDHVAAMTALVSVAREAEAARIRVESAYDHARGLVEAELVKVDRALDPIRGQSAHSEILAQVRDPADAARAILGTGKNPGACAAALSLAKEALALAEELAANIGNLSIEGIESRQRQIDAVLNSGTYKKLRPNDHASIKARADALAKGWMKKSPEQASAAYDEMVLLVATGVGQLSFKGRCDAQKAWKQEIETLCSQAETAVSTLDRLAPPDGMGKATGGKYAGALRTGLDAIKALKDGGEPSDIAMADARAKALAIKVKAEGYASLTPREISKPSSDLAIEFFRDQNAASNAALEKARALEVFDADYEKLNTLYKSNSGHSAAKANIEEYKAIGRQLEAGRTSADKAGDFAAARASLKRAGNRLDQLLNGGPTIDRGKLRQIASIWNGAVQDFEAKCDALVVAVRGTVSGTDRAGDERKVAAAMAAVRVAVSGIGFSAEAVVLGDERASAERRKRAREMALAKLRQVNDLIGRNPAIRLAVGNPFGVAGVATRLHNTARDIELEVLRGA